MGWQGFFGPHSVLVRDMSQLSRKREHDREGNWRTPRRGGYPWVGQTNQELRHPRTQTFLVTYLVKLPPSRLLGVWSRFLVEESARIIVASTIVPVVIRTPFACKC